MNFIKRHYKNNWVKWFFIPVLLFALWSSLTLFYIIVLDESFLIVSYSHHKDNFEKLTYSRLQKGDVVRGSFVGQSENLGILGLRIKSYLRVPYREEDKLVFRIKEQGSKDWYYENTYRSGMMYEFQLFPFGFPIITDSKGKVYEFELESLQGNTENSISIQGREPIFVSKYQTLREDFKNDPVKIILFGIRKMGNYKDNIEVQFSSFIYLLPLFFYLMSLFSLHTKLFKVLLNFYNPFRLSVKKLDYYFYSAVLGTLIIFDIAYLQVQNSVMFLFVGIFMFILNKMFRVESKNTLAVGLVLLLLSIPCYYLESFQIAERSASWSYIFLVLSVIQMYGENEVKISKK